MLERSTELPTLYQLDDERVLYKTEDVYTMLLLYDDLKIHIPKSLLKRIEGFTEEDFTACDVPRLLEILVNTGTPTPEPLMNLLYSLTTEELEGFETAEVAAIYNPWYHLASLFQGLFLKSMGAIKANETFDNVNSHCDVFHALTCPSGPSLVSLRAW